MSALTVEDLKKAIAQLPNDDKLALATGLTAPDAILRSEIWE